MTSTTTTAQTRLDDCPESPVVPCKNSVGWRKVVRNFTPSWFAASMGTGIVSILLHELPYTAPWVAYLSYAFFGLNALLFCASCLISAARYILYPSIWSAMIAHPAQSLFLGCIPMALATLINMMALCISHAWGPAFVYFTWSLWWLDALLSMAVCTSMPFVVMSRHQPSLDAITAALLLPIVPAVVAAASGALVGRVLLDSHLPAYAFTTLVASYVLWGVGISFSACVLALYFLRLTVHSLPPREVIVSVMLPIGPMGQGGFGIQKLGALAVDVLPAHAANSHIFPVLLTGSDTAAAATAAAQVLYVLGVLFGLLMWATGIVWLAYALSSIATTKSFPFNMGWWGFTFPIGVLATCTGALATNLDSAFFRVFTMMLSISVVALWAVVAVRTVFVVGHGDVFPAPCLKDLKDRE